jgi:hypothetical protein
MTEGYACWLRLPAAVEWQSTLADSDHLTVAWQSPLADSACSSDCMSPAFAAGRIVWYSRKILLLTVVARFGYYMWKLDAGCIAASLTPAAMACACSCWLYI